MFVLIWPYLVNFQFEDWAFFETADGQIWSFKFFWSGNPATYFFDEKHNFEKAEQASIKVLKLK